jgi:outer membrane protein TolC
VETLRDRSRLAYLRYEGGVDTLLNALDANRELFNAELDLTQTKRNEVLSLVQLYKHSVAAGSNNYLKETEGARSLDSAELFFQTGAISSR